MWILASWRRETAGTVPRGLCTMVFWMCRQPLGFSLVLYSSRKQFCFCICQMPTQPPQGGQLRLHTGTEIPRLGTAAQPMGRGAFWLSPQRLQGPQAAITKYLPAVPKNTPSLRQEEQAAAPVQYGYISSCSKTTEPMGRNNPTK